MNTSTKRPNFWPIFGIIAVIVIGAAAWYIASAPWQNNDQAYTPPPSGLVQGETLTLEGKIACLPHKDQSGPQTMECAIGFQADQKYYALKNLTPDALAAYQTGSDVKLTGVFTPAGTDEKYDIAGTIDVTEIASANSGSQGNVSSYDNNEFNFSLSYDADFKTLNEDDNARLPWSYDSDFPGRRLVTLSLPQSFMPKTNFSEGMVSVGVATNSSAVASCLKASQGKVISQTDINGTKFTVISVSDAGAGNLYETTSYRTLKDKTCFALEATIHSTNIGNYSPDQGITEFDKAKIAAKLDTVVKSFHFSK